MCGQILFLNWHFSLPSTKREKWYLDMQLEESATQVFPSACYKKKKKSFSLILRINLVVRRCPDIKILHLLSTQTCFK